MSAIDSDPEQAEIELVNGFGADSLESTPVPHGRRTTKRWSFHNHGKPVLFDKSGGNTKRRLSDIDMVHKEIDPFHISPAQLYSTESGRLFHAGKICIVLCGLPGRGKTHLAVSLTRYLRWLGVKTHSFHLGNYRRAKAEADLDFELFMPRVEDNAFRQNIVGECIDDILHFFENDKGQVAIYDAVNALPEHRLELNDKFAQLNIQALFIESLVTEDQIISKNVEQAARSSPDYKNWDYAKAYKDYSDRIKVLTPYYLEMGDLETKLSYIKFINFGERIELHNSNYGYLIQKVVFYLMNSRIKSGSVFFARCYKNDLDFSFDPPLDSDGDVYAKNLTETILRYMKKQGKPLSLVSDRKDKEALSLDQRHPTAGVDGTSHDSFVVWTSVKQRTIQATKYLSQYTTNIRHRIQLAQKNPGVAFGMTEEEIKKEFPTDYENFVKDPYHHRFSRAESYHDLAIKIEPLILEMERMSGDILIIADETVLRVFYGYLMSCNCYDIPSLNFATDEIIEIKFNAYYNSAKVIPIKDFSSSANALALVSPESL
ncbi:uncharacterized protein KQ657_000034 [Scheffersomyces spartinae]|uniref:6-phosphofructo-2-kinase domain-containing protein n=1 Tax=Scheffersomyces spartinae TaxID=45513 RepID=A0A9P7VDY0_9ASCO|nr:uncharacterized protein KQ657_000034 [Scheffersomyces spartinae]KAG7196027.1 hypothetical protein KQ657_000034 [Scheffersomyces spartinae]